MSKKLKATFIGKDKSMGLRTGQTYNITIKEGSFVHVHVSVELSLTHGISCPYQTIVKFLDNWDNIHQYK